MAYAPGFNYKIGATVDPSFTAAMRQAADQTAQANAISANFASTLKAVKEQTASGALTAQQAAKIEADALRDTSKALRDLVKDKADVVAVTEQAVVISKVQVQQLEQEATAAGLTAQQYRQLGLSTRAAFAGNYGRSITGLTRLLGEYTGAIMIALGAAELIKMGLNKWEEAEKSAGDAIAEESKTLAEASTEWHKYADAVKAAESAHGGPKNEGGLYLPSNASPAEEEKHYKALAERSKNLSPEAVYDVFHKEKHDPQIDNLKSGLSQAQGQLKKIDDTLDPLRKSAAELSKTISEAQKAEDAQFPGRYGHTDRHGDYVQDHARPKTDDTIKLASLQKQIQNAEFSEHAPKSSIATIGPMLKDLQKLDHLDHTLKTISGQVGAIKELGDQAGGRAGILGEQTSLRELLTKAGHEYRATTGKGTDTESLYKTIMDGSSSERKRAKELLDLNKSGKSVDDRLRKFDIGELEEEFQARKEAGQYGSGTKRKPGDGPLTADKDDAFSSSHAAENANKDELATIARERSLLDPDDNKGKTQLDRRQFKIEGAEGQDQFKSKVDDLREQYKELAATGTATAKELAAANDKVTKAAKDWAAENSVLIASHKELKHAVDQVINAGAVEKNKLILKGQEEAMLALKQSFGEQDAEALTLGERIKANKAEEEQLADARNKGLITAKQYTAELVALEKQRGSINKAVQSALEAQTKAMDATKTKMAGQEISHLDYEDAHGRGRPGDSQKREQLQAEQVKAQLRQIEDEYERAAKNGPEVAAKAAQEATLKKTMLYRQEADAFEKAEDAKTAVLEREKEKRVGGKNSPLTGLHGGASFSGVEFSGLGDFGDNFGKFHKTRNAFDDYSSNTNLLPDAVQNAFKQKQGFEGGSSAPIQNNNNLTIQSLPPNVQDLVKQVCVEMGKTAQWQSLTSGTGAPPMTANQTIWDGVHA